MVQFFVPKVSVYKEESAPRILNPYAHITFPLFFLVRVIFLFLSNAVGKYYPYFLALSKLIF